MRNLLIACCAATLWILLLCAPALAQQERPNILWITSEDNGPQLGCYGDDFATTPHIDALAARGMYYERAWSNAPVCAPARTVIITGMHATSLGAEHMRSMVKLPQGIQLFPQYLRAAGYYCTNKSKEDYNVEKPGKVWDESGGKAHWRKRKEGQPFFSVINIGTTHESRIRKRPHKQVHDPAKVRVPAYHPDHPIVRKDWAQYYDKMTEMDAQVGKILAQLDEDGLTESTIIFYYGDHGPGMPRGKRWPYDSGLRVPMVVHFPEKYAALAPAEYKAGAMSKRLVSFVDLAPTVLSLAGLEAPKHMQGGAFAGEHSAPAPEYMYGYRGRMDERIDLVRSITDGRYVYIHNFMPHRPQGVYLDYMFQTPTTRIWKELYDKGELESRKQRGFWDLKPKEEIYDLSSDPDEVENLAWEKSAEKNRERLWRALRSHMLNIHDLGFIPEGERHRLNAGVSLYDPSLFEGRGADYNPLQLQTKAQFIWEPMLLAMMNTKDREYLGDNQDLYLGPGRETKDDNPLASVRYWGLSWMLTRRPDDVDRLVPFSVERYGSLVVRALEDPSPTVRIEAAEIALYRELQSCAQQARDVLLASSDVRQTSIYDAIQALNAIDATDFATPWPAADIEKLRKLPTSHKDIPGRFRNYVPRLLEHILERHPPARVEQIYKTIGDIELRLFINQPAGSAPKKGRPAVVFFHGGGWNGGDPNQFFDHTEHLAKKGIVGISAAYRLIKKHKTTPYECVADGKSALRWVREHAKELGIDAARIAAGGGSAGGHIAAAVATVNGFDDEPDSKTSCRPDALILFNPVYDNGPTGYGQKRVMEHWEAFSPLHNIRKGLPPSIVFLGTQDSLIPVETGRLWEERAQAVGSHSELHLYEGQPHGFFNRNKSAESYADTILKMDSFLSSLGWMR